MPNLSYCRYQDLAKIVNTAIKEKADILVLPECYIPLAWLTLLSRKSALNKMAIICGIEHVVISKNGSYYKRKNRKKMPS